MIFVAPPTALPRGGNNQSTRLARFVNAWVFALSDCAYQEAFPIFLARLWSGAWTS